MQGEKYRCDSSNPNRVKDHCPCKVRKNIQIHIQTAGNDNSTAWKYIFTVSSVFTIRESFFLFLLKRFRCFVPQNTITDGPSVLSVTTYIVHQPAKTNWTSPVCETKYIVKLDVSDWRSEREIEAAPVYFRRVALDGQSTVSGILCASRHYPSGADITGTALRQTHTEVIKR